MVWALAQSDGGSVLGGILGAIALFIGLLLLIGLYFVPTIIAGVRRHHNTLAIFALNLLLGWTFLGWVGALVWSFTATGTHTGGPGGPGG